jgi:hypothetical protein
MNWRLPFAAIWLPSNGNPLHKRDQIAVPATGSFFDLSREQFVSPLLFPLKMYVSSFPQARSCRDAKKGVTDRSHSFRIAIYDGTSFSSQHWFFSLISC